MKRAAPTTPATAVMVFSGMGWSLGGLSVVHRCPKTVAQDSERGGINFDTDDRFCVDKQRLIVISGTYGADGAEYRTEVALLSIHEPNFATPIPYSLASTFCGSSREYSILNNLYPPFPFSITRLQLP